MCTSCGLKKAEVKGLCKNCYQANYIPKWRKRRAELIRMLQERVKFLEEENNKLKDRLIERS